MTSYFSTFITGFDNVIAVELSEQLKDVTISLLTDGLVIYTTSSSLDEISSLKFLNNSFVLFKKFENVSENSMKDILKSLTHDSQLTTFVQDLPHNPVKFRVRASVRNQFVKIDMNVLKNLEDKIAQASPNLTLDRSLPDIEFLITIRSEGFALAGMQFTKRPNYEKTLCKGELYPEIAYILCLISDPQGSDVFLDPFTGHGSIPAARLNLPHQEIIAGEIDRDLQKELELKFGKDVRVDPANVLSLNTFADGSVDKIVTDPPWGLYDTDLNIPELYTRALNEFYRVLKPGGILVILTAQKEILESLIRKMNGQLRLLKTYSTLVSGKKAGVYKIRKM